MESIIFCSPPAQQLVGAAHRNLANYPTSYFHLTEVSREALPNMKRQYQAFLGDKPYGIRAGTHLNSLDIHHLSPVIAQSFWFEEDSM
jgi:tRNA G10  N-methylase Trm11